jgi:uncharacterized protein (TIGR04255 family)
MAKLPQFQAKPFVKVVSLQEQYHLDDWVGRTHITKDARQSLLLRGLLVRGVRLSQELVRLGGGESHAIEVMALGVEWSAPLSDEVLSRLVAVYSARPDIAGFLPGKKHLQGLSIRMEGPETQLSTGTSSLVDFTRSRPDGSVEWAISLRPDFISCNTSAYVGWKAAKPRLIGLLRPFVEVAVSLGASIQAIGLQYLDTFRWPQSDGNRVEEILSRQSAWVPVRCFQQPFLWHVHQGWFTEAPQGRRVLNNLNIDLQHEDGDTKLVALKIHGQHRLQAVGFKSLSQTSIHEAELESAADMLHQMNKDALAELLTPAIIKRIGLNLAPSNVH